MNEEPQSGFKSTFNSLFHFDSNHTENTSDFYYIFMKYLRLFFYFFIICLLLYVMYIFLISAFIFKAKNISND